MKPAKFVGRAREEMQSLPIDGRKEAGRQIFRVQAGLQPHDFKPMPSVGKGVFEIRVRDQGRNTVRIFYVAKFEEAVYVLHAFEKKSQATPKRNIEIGKQRYRTVLDERRKHHG